MKGIDMAVAMTDGFPYRFSLGTTGIVVECVVEVIAGVRTLKDVKYTKQAVFMGDPPVVGTEKQAEEAWKREPMYKRTHRSLREEITRVTQAVYPS